jgi:hypothetical protein
MRKAISIEELRIGRHVVLPVSWFNHPFLKNEPPPGNLRKIRLPFILIPIPKS